MAKLPKILLTATVACLGLGMLFSIGMVNVRGTPGLYVALPAGAICYGLFLIWHMLETEVTRFDAEHPQDQRQDRPACVTRPSDAPTDHSSN